MFCTERRYLKLCFLTIITGTCLAKLKLPNKNDSQGLYFSGRRWFVKNKNFKYILHWTSPKAEPFFASGTDAFTKANCSSTNCIVTTNKTRLKYPRYFDAIIFHGPDFWYKPILLDRLPVDRSQKQKYIYYSAESAHYYPMCDKEFDDFFNITWTYKLNSDLPAPYLIIKNKVGKVIGPKQTMHWMDIESMYPIDSALKEKLKSKSKAVAWIVSICKTASEREKFAQALIDSLTMSGFVVEVFGKCHGNGYWCGRPDLMLPDCWDVIQEEFYFYLSFENSFDEDYVTEKLLNPLQHYTVPIVYGAANYSRFLPEGSYLNAKELGVIRLKEEIINIIGNKERYYSFFKWHNHYSYHHPNDSPETNSFCSLCEMLNKGTRQNKHLEFRRWWNLPGKCPMEAPTTPKRNIFFI